MLELRRNVAHLILGIFLAYLVVSLQHALVIVINLSLIGCLLLSVYLYNEYHIAFLAWLFARFDRPSKFTARGAIIFFVGTLVAILLFAPEFAALSILVLAVSDSIATITGHYAGKHKLLRGKTLEGTSAFFVSTCIILAFFVTPTRALLVALATSLAELVTPAYIDDNLIIPVVTGLLLSI